MLVMMMVLIKKMGLVVIMVIMVITMGMMMVTIMWWLIAMMGAPSKAVGRREILTMGHYAPFMEPSSPWTESCEVFILYFSLDMDSVHQPKFLNSRLWLLTICGSIITHLCFRPCVYTVMISLHSKDKLNNHEHIYRLTDRKHSVKETRDSN